MAVHVAPELLARELVQLAISHTLHEHGDVGGGEALRAGILLRACCCGLRCVCVCMCVCLCECVCVNTLQHSVLTEVLVK